TVSFADCIYEGNRMVEGVECRKVGGVEEALELLSSSSAVPLIVDESGKTIEELHPGVVVDAIIAKKNLGTSRSMAPLTVALGPGFEAGKDVDVVIETMRGHNLGRLIYSGSALPNTGTPGLIGGKGKERVIHSSVEGVFRGAKEIGDIVEEGETVAYIGDVPQKTTISGRLRGLLHDGIYVPEHFKIADVDPRGAETDHTTVSDKARALGGAVLEALDAFFAKTEY
ncbi:MAG: selenium-dependent molybdenum cofactor biosynthesis protein YqeB, partial [Candidatus Ornithospirochaeta sp.]